MSFISDVDKSWITIVESFTQIFNHLTYSHLAAFTYPQ